MILPFLMTACASTSPHVPAAPTQADRILQAYKEIERGRLLILADFEDPAQLALFSLSATSQDSEFVLDRKKGKKETGTNCLLATMGSAGDAIVIANAPESQSYLKRDWRPYDLLMVSVHAPQDELSLEVGIGSGAPTSRMYAYSSTPLTRGWNLVRLDLAEAGENIPLDDVREIRLSVSGVNKPLPIRFDDILLAGNRVDLHGDSTNKEGLLYVQQAGRRWNVGAGGRFEFAFSNGQITGLFNTSVDPYRLRNLVRGTTMGPSPVVLDEAQKMGDFSPLGRSVSARQRIVEMSAVRVVIETEWRFLDRPSDTPDRRPFHRWVYTVYPTGQIFVGVEATTETESWSPPKVGLALTFAAGAQEHVSTMIGHREAADSGSGDRLPVFGLARVPGAESSLLFIPYPTENSTELVELPDEQNRRSSFVYTENSPRASVRRWACQVVVGGFAELDETQAAQRAVDYSQTGSVRLDIGRRAKADHGLLRSDGFDPASGTYLIGTELNRVRLTVDARERATFSPAFQITGGQGVRSWVYAGHLIHTPVAVSPDGTVLFQLRRAAKDQVLVEVLFQHSSSNARSP